MGCVHLGVVAEVWCRVTIIGPDSSELVSGELRGSGVPDLVTVDGIARLALFAVRVGGSMYLSEVSPVLGALLDLAGLDLAGLDLARPDQAGLRVEMDREAERGEEALRVQRSQEERHGRDLPP